MEDKTLPVTAPPPPAEVKIRTMRSDLASMRASGGGMPTFQNVVVKGLSLEKSYSTSIHPTSETHTAAPAAYSNYSAPVETPVSAPAPASMPAASVTPAAVPPSEPASAPTTQSSAQGPGNSFVPILIVTLVAIIAIGVVGYFAYITFFK